MVDPILNLTYLTVVVLIGMLCTIISGKLKIPNVLLLLLSGILLRNLKLGGAPLLVFSTEFITAISILALIMIVFDSTSRLSFKEFDESSSPAIKLTTGFILFTLVLLSAATYFVFEGTLMVSILFATLMIGTAPDVVLSMVGDSKNRIMQILSVESIINTPIVVLLPFLMVEFMATMGKGTFSIATEFLKPFLLQIFTGAGVGLMVALVVFKVMRRYYSESLSPLAVISTSLLSYVLAENIGGNGVLSVTVAGLIFANFSIRHKIELMSFSKLFSIILEILVFIFVGLLIRVPTDLIVIIKSILLFLIYIIIRYFSVYFTLKSEVNWKERLFMTLNMPKGIATAVVAALLIGKVDNQMLDLTLLFMMYSIVMSTVVIKFSKYFVRTKVIK